VKKKKKKGQDRDRGVLLIAIFKLFKCALLLSLGIGALTLLHKNVESALTDLLATLHVDHNNRYLHGLVVRLGLADDRKLTAIGAGSFFYAALMATEGIGLLLRKRWANYLTIIATALFIPLEIYELFKKFGLARLAILVVNIAVVGYLAYRLRAERKI
jgi:uncharacterized membrane protein (DUF2068 family)